MKKTTKYALIASGAALCTATAAVVGFKMALEGILHEALDRNEPPIVRKTRERMMNSAVAPETLELAERQAETLSEGAPELAEIDSFDGTHLVGHIHRAEHPKRIIVAMHGWRSSWTRDFGVISPFFWENDSTVLYAEQRGQGESEGAFMGFGMVERHDCVAWVNYAVEHISSELPIYLVGVSMGASTVLMASGDEKLPSNAHGIIADCGFTSANEIWRHVSTDNLHLAYEGLVEKGATAFCRKWLEMEPDAYSTLDAMAVCKTPVLFIHGKADNFVPCSMSEQNYEACAAPKRILLVDGADHGLSYIVDKDAYEAAVLDFWKTYDV